MLPPVNRFQASWASGITHHIFSPLSGIRTWVICPKAAELWFTVVSNWKSHSCGRSCFMGRSESPRSPAQLDHPRPIFGAWIYLLFDFQVQNTNINNMYKLWWDHFIMPFLLLSQSVQPPFLGIRICFFEWISWSFFFCCVLGGMFLVLCFPGVSSLPLQDWTCSYWGSLFPCYENCGLGFQGLKPWTENNGRCWQPWASVIGLFISLHLWFCL